MYCGDPRSNFVTSGDGRHGLRGLAPQMGRLAPTVKHTGQASGGELCEIFKFWSFLRSKSVNSVCKLLQLLCRRLPTGAFPWTPLGDFCPQTLWAISDPVGYTRPSGV